MIEFPSPFFGHLFGWRHGNTTPRSSVRDNPCWYHPMAFIPKKKSMQCAVQGPVSFSILRHHLMLLLHWRPFFSITTSRLSVLLFSVHVPLPASWNLAWKKDIWVCMRLWNLAWKSTASYKNTVFFKQMYHFKEDGYQATWLNYYETWEEILPLGLFLLRSRSSFACVGFEIYFSIFLSNTCLMCQVNVGYQTRWALWIKKWRWIPLYTLPLRS